MTFFKTITTLLIFLIIGLIIGYGIQTNSRFYSTGGSSCSTHSKKMYVKSSFTAGYPFTYFEQDIDRTYSNLADCNADSKKYAFNDDIDASKINWEAFALNVVITGGVLALLLMLMYLIFSVVLKVPFRWSWLLSALIISIIMNVLSFGMLATLSLPILAVPVLWLFGWAEELVSLDANLATSLAQLFVLPTIFYATILYLLFWIVSKLIKKQ